MPGFVSWLDECATTSKSSARRTSAGCSPRRCSRGCRWASTGWRSCCWSRPRPARSASAGAAAGALALGTGLGAPVTARLIDAPRARACCSCLAAVPPRWPARRRRARARRTRRPLPLVVVGVRSPAALPAGVVGAARAVPAAVRRPARCCCRARSRSTRCCTESIFTVGPLLTAAARRARSSRRPRSWCSRRGRADRGTVALVAALPPGATATRRGGRRRSGGLGALAVPGIRTLVATMLPVGFAFGALEVALPAFADAEGRPGAGGRARRAVGARQRRRRARVRRAAAPRVAGRRPPADRAAAAAQLPAARARGLAGDDGAARAVPPAC